MFLKRSAIAVQALLWMCWLLTATLAEETKIASDAGVAERAFPFKALPVQLTVERAGESLPVTRVPALRRGDVVRLRVELEAPELTSQNADERRRLRDWSVGWFLTTPEGSLVFDSTSKGKTDRGRIDLEREEREVAITVEHDRQQFPIFFFVRTRTLESWEEIRRTRQTKASNFVDHFGKYSDVVGDYEDLQAFLKSLQREGEQPETLEDRLSAGFTELGFTVDSKTRLSDPEVVATLLEELESSLSSQSRTFKAEAAGKLLSQMIGDSDLGLIGAAASIGGVLYRATDYSESYHWSSARLKEVGEGRYWVMSAERIRHGEDEKAPDGSARANVRSILVCTPMATERGDAPDFGWTSDGVNSLAPAKAGEPPEVRITSDHLQTRTHPALVQRYLSPTARVWDSKHGDDSPLTARIGAGGSLEIRGLSKLWSKGDTSAKVKVVGRWGFDPVPLVEMEALRAVAEKNAVTMPNAPYLLSQGQRYRLNLHSNTPIAVGRARLAGRDVKVERGSGDLQIALDAARLPEGPASLEIFAGQSTGASNLVHRQEFWVISSSNFHVLLPQNSKTCQLMVRQPELEKALDGAQAVKVGSTLFRRRPGTFLFDATEPLSPGRSELSADLLFEGGRVSQVHLERPETPGEVTLELFSRPSPSRPPYRVELPPHLLARGEPIEFRLRSPRPWRGGTELIIELLGPADQVMGQSFSATPGPAQRPMRVKGNLLFGDYKPKGTGLLSCRFRSPLESSSLALEWGQTTPWRVVDVPRITQVSRRDNILYLRGQDLDIAISRVFHHPDPGQDPEGARLQRLPDGRYAVTLTGVEAEEFWIELSDLPGEGRRFRVVPFGIRQTSQDAENWTDDHSQRESSR